MKIVTIVGARPQFIKASLVSKVLEKEGIKEVLLHTGQHFDDNMSQVFFDQFGINQPSYNLHIKGLSHGAMTGQMLQEIEKVLLQEKPDYTLVYGDTNSTLAGALASVKLNIPIAHVEGGLRNNDFTVPEDVNRTLTDRISNIIFYSTEQAHKNLVREGYNYLPTRLIRTDDLMSDLYFYTYKQIQKNPTRIVNDLSSGREYILSTIHRQLTTEEENLKNVVLVLNAISEEIDIILPVHPRTKKVLSQVNWKLSDRIKLIDPVGYFEMFELLQNAKYVITDSGGLQKEAYLHGKYSMLLMDFTPWVELVQHKVSIESTLDHKSLKDSYQKMKMLNGSFSQNLYGQGNAAPMIVSSLIT